MSAAMQNAMSRRRGMITMHEEIALQAADRTQKRYLNTLNFGRPAPYRLNAPDRWKRYGGGALERALGSSNMYRVTYDGIAFGDFDWLDSQAKQWYRLNFGAGKRARSASADRPRARRLKIFAQDTGLSIDLKGWKPSAAFRMPSHLWFDGTKPVRANMASRGTHELVPWRYIEYFNGTERFQKLMGPGAEVRVPYDSQFTAGIEPRNFLDAGVAYIGGALPAAYEKLIGEWIKDAKSSTGPLTKAGVSKSKAAKFLTAYNKLIK